jgi:cell division protease FtsH
LRPRRAHPRGVSAHDAAVSCHAGDAGIVSAIAKLRRNAEGWRERAEAVSAAGTGAAAGMGIAARIAFGKDAIMATDIEIGADVKMGAELGAGADVKTGAELRPGADVKTGAELRPGADVKTGAGLGMGAGFAMSSDIEMGADIEIEKKPAIEPSLKAGDDGAPQNANSYPAGQEGPSGKNRGQPAGNAPKNSNLFNIIVIVFLITIFVNLIFASRSASNITQIEYSQFIKLVEGGLADKVQIDDDMLHIQLKKDADASAVERILSPDGRGGSAAAATAAAGQGQPTLSPVGTYSAARIDDPALVERLDENGVSFYRQIAVSKSPILGFVMTWILPVLLMYFIYSFVFRRLFGKMGQGGPGGGGMGGIFGVGKSKAKEYSLEKNMGVRFSDVAGQDEAKESLTEMSDYLHDPKKYQEIGAKQPRGALLVGPPGTGKTLLAKALAGEAGVPFYSISGSEFVEMFVGVGASRVRDLFENAKKNAPCIVFIDEIDAIGKSRDSQIGGNDEREQTLNQLLAEMDGFDGEKGIVVLAATNRPEVLDKALLRPGRFDRRIIVEKPDLPGREAILAVHAGKVKLSDDVNLHELAIATSGATGADLANMINEGALLAVKKGRKTVRQKDMMEAVEVVVAGKEKKDRVMNAKERRMVAYHEVGHALVSALQKNSQPVQKITIIPRTMGSLGYTMSMPEEDRYLMTKSELLAQITVLLGGRAAEIAQFGEVTTGASNDIERATALARGMVTQYGMSDALGPISLESAQSRYLDGSSVKNCSQQTETKIDDEVRLILTGCQQKASKLLEGSRASLDKIAEYLLDKENITGDEFMKLLEPPSLA